MASSKCCDNPPQLNPAGGEGKVIDSFGGLKAYVVGSDDCKAAVVLVSEVYAKIVVELAKSREIQAAVLLHPTFVTVDDIKEVKCPVSILGAEIDKYSPPELMEQFKIVLSANYGVSHFVKIFPGVRHGWSVRYRDHDTAALKNAEEAMPTNNNTSSGVLSTLVAVLPSGAASLAASVRPLPPVILDLDAFNFSRWNTHLRALLGHHGLLSHINGTVAAAPQDVAWVQNDYAVLTAMYGLISRDVLDLVQIEDDMSARDLWVAVEDLFNDNKDGRSINLLSKFHALVQGDMTVSAYLKEQKRLADTLRDADSVIDNRILVLNTIRGLNPRLLQAASFISMSAALPTFRKLRSQLVFEERRLENTAKAAAATAMVASAGQTPPCTGSSCRSSTPSSSSSSTNNRLPSNNRPKNNGRRKGGDQGHQRSFNGPGPLPGIGPWICYNLASGTWAAPGMVLVFWEHRRVLNRPS
ncbi:hypothetical protein PR202_gb01081 [Eleusine coracana subsp. coracana]|uniref:Dienelactone hydrolase domain-containing protein n=1 Tax=Eleusine coracana subsp. coracana TaxID=191504 RepID=A0AAV5DT91_ELECO|nr:hypothetical protein PR202_gb01081 [Eleusine coracana subsp. coracana]